MLKIMLKKRPTTKAVGKFNTASQKWETDKFMSILNIVAVDEEGNIVKTFDPICSELMTEKEFEEFNEIDFKNRKLKACLNEMKDSVSDDLVIKENDRHYSDIRFLVPFEIFFQADGILYLGEYCTYDSDDLAKNIIEAAERNEIESIVTYE